jgi:hypothetical protein
MNQVENGTSCSDFRLISESGPSADTSDRHVVERVTKELINLRIVITWLYLSKIP